MSYIIPAVQFAAAALSIYLGVKKIIRELKLRKAIKVKQPLKP